MPAINVEVPDLGTVEFPEGTSEDTINEAINSYLTQKSAPKQSFVQPEQVPQDSLQRAAQDALSQQQTFGKVLPTGITSGQPIEFGGTTITGPQDQIGLPTVRPPAEAGIPEKVAAGLWNTGAGLVNFPLSATGAATAMIPELAPAKYLAPILKATFMGLAAKQAGEAAGTASVTKDPQDITEAAGATGLLGLIAKAEPSLPGAAQEALTSLGETLGRRKQDASRIQKAAEVHGDLRAQPEQGQGEVPVAQGGAGVQPQAPAVAKSPQVPLTAEEQSYLDTERAGLDVPVEVIEELFSHKPEEPFATGQIATVDRTNGKILINRPEFQAWIKAVPEGQKANAVKALLSEERIHLGVDDQSATDYWNNLTSIEKAIERRRYTGEWGGQGINDTLMGHEAVRFRLQQLARMEPREIAEAVGRERWTVKGITALENIIRGLREKFATKASLAQLGILDRLEANLNIAKGVVGRTPSAFRKFSDDDLLESDPSDPLKIPAASDAQKQWLREHAGMQLESRDPNIELQVRPSGIWAINHTKEGHGVAYTHHSQLGDFVNGNFNNKTLPDATRQLALKAAREIEYLYEEGIPESHEQSFPAAYRKKAKETSEQDIMFLPPPERGELIERSVWPTPNALAVESAAANHFEEALKAGKAPSFDEFNNELKGQYGSSISRDASYYAWTDAMTKRLMNAKGAELESLVDSLGLRGKLQAEHQVGFGKGSIPDPIELSKLHQAQFEELAKQFPHRKAITPRLVRQWFGPALRRRYAAIGTVMERLTEEAGEKPSKPWDRTEVGPEEINQIAGQRQFRAITPEEAADPATVANLATEGSAVDATGKGAPPRTVSRNLIALRDKSGRIVLASTWKDPRSGARVTDPTSANLPSRKIDASLLRDWTPVSVMNLREPIQGFRKVFESHDAFSKWFGDVGIEGTPGIRPGMFAGPNADIANLAQGKGAEGGPGRPEAEPLTTEAPSSETARELTGEPGQIPTGTAAYRSPRTGPPPAEQLPLNARLEAQARAREAFPYEPTQYNPSAELEARGIHIMPGARGERTPAAIRKSSSELTKNVKDALTKIIMRMPAKADIFRLRDAADHNADLLTEGAKNSIIAASRPPLKEGETRPQMKAIAERARMNRIGAVAWVTSGGKLNKVKFYSQALRDAKDRVARWKEDPNPIKRREALKDEKYIAEMKAGLDWAREHWKDPDFVKTAQSVKTNLESILEEERKAGKTIESYENYYPGVWEGDFWNSDFTWFAGKKLLGEKYRMPKRFHNPYEAIADGPYRLASTDVADVTAHRMRQGYRWIETHQFNDAVKSIRDRSSGEPIAMDAIPVFKGVTDPDTGQIVSALVGYKSPKAGYEILNDKEPLAMMTPYKQAYSWAVSPSRIDQFAIGTVPVGRIALVANQLLKHNVILLWDTFHPGRLVQYSTALSGLGKVGFKGGSTALSFRPEDLPSAVASGLVHPKAAEWALSKVAVQTRHGPVEFTRQEILQEMVRQGLNAKRFTDTLYKEAIRNVPIIGEAWHKLIGPWNRMLFDNFIPGVMAETAVHNFEKLNAKNPNVNFTRLMKDVVKDTNIFFGNMGRQGIFKSRTAQDFGRMFLLAPLWQEGLYNKEIRFATRLLGGAARGVGIDLPYRRGLPMMGELGNAMGKGLFSYFVATQAINLVSRGKPTWDNEQEGHKLDAWVPAPWSKNGGFWLSPLSVFAEMTHDIIRLHQTKPTWREAAMQIGMNRASPVGKMMLVGITGMNPRNERFATTGGWLAGTAGQVIPGVGAAPITFSVPGREIAHAVAPNLVSPNQPGAWMRQAIAAGAGIKTELPQTNIQQAGKMTRDFMESSGLRKDEGWVQVQTDQPNYAKLRSALRMDDQPNATKMLSELRKTHTDDQIERAMKIWAKRPWTGSYDNDAKLMLSLKDKQLETFNRADQERLELLNSFYQLLMKE